MIEQFAELYGDIGLTGCIVVCFLWLIYSLNTRSNAQQSALEQLSIINKGQEETLENMESMIIKLIGRWNTSDDRMDRKFDAMTKEINDMDNQLSEIRGNLARLNGRH